MKFQSFVIFFSKIIKNNYHYVYNVIYSKSTIYFHLFIVRAFVLQTFKISYT